MSWVDTKGKRHFTQKDMELVNMLANHITQGLVPIIKESIEKTKMTREPPTTSPNFARKYFQQDFEKLSKVPRSAFRLFVFLFKNGRSHLLDIQKDSGIPQRTIYSALKILEKENLIDKNHEDCWFIKAKGFIPFT